MQTKYSLTVTGRARLELLSRVTTLLGQRQVGVEEVSYKQTTADTCNICIICATDDPDTMKRIINQLSDYIDIATVNVDEL